ncbi:MAG TPA: hypothetical protein VNU25_02155 [Candidatus Paceibacterota bacterium]|nr:hypothetical protein [Candidatus Paceibacterota bacterium]
MEYETAGRDSIPHYHGDKVRILFLATAAIGAVGIPFWGHLVPYGTLFEVLGGIVLIVLAGLANPRSRWVMVLSIIVAAFGVFLLEASAIAFHTRDPFELLVAREVTALLLGAALYFSVKTLRAMVQGRIGERPTPWEFEKPETHE